MNRFVACLTFLIGLPLLFAAGVCGFEYAAWRLMPDRFPSGEDLISRILSGHVPPIVAGVTFAVIGCGIWDIIDMFGGFSDYRQGMRGYLPKQNPLGFVRLRARRYVLVFVVAAAAFVVCYVAPSTREFPPFLNTRRPHLWLAGVALLVARRPLNTEPVLGLLLGIIATLKMFDQSTDAFTSGKAPPTDWDYKKR